MPASRFPSTSPANRGFTLIELLVVIAIIAVLIALLLPAVQSAREAARRAQCVNNLKQLGLAAFNYESSNACFPPVGIAYVTGTKAWGYGHGVFVRTLPFYEQQALFSAVNLNMPETDPSNITIAGVGLSTLWCPSDPTANTITNLASPSTGANTIGSSNEYVLPPGTVWNQYCTSYLINEGPFGVSNRGKWGISDWLEAWQTPAYQGVLVTIASVTDGLSSTVLYSERTMSIAAQSFQNPATTQYPFWNLGVDEMCAFDSQFAPNPQRYIPTNSVWMQRHASYIASSRHPGGVNCGFADGSVKFIKDTINAWPNLAAGSPYGDYGAPSSYYTTSTSGISLKPGVTIGVWQAITTTNWGEVVSSDQY